MRFKKIVILLVLIGSMVAVKSYGQLNRPYFYNLGRDFIMQGRYSDAISALNMLLRSQPEEYEGYFLRGVAKYNLGDLYGAKADFTLSLDYNPIFLQALQYRGITLSRLGQYEESLGDFALAIEMRPSFSGAYYSRAVTNFLNQQFDRAISDYDTFIRLEPLSAEGYVNRGTAKLYLKDSTAAMSDYNMAIKVNPYFEDGYLRRGVLYLVGGDTQKGIEDMDSALSLDSTAAIGYFYRAMGNNQLGNIMGALSDFDNAVKFDPTNSVAIFNRAILRSQIGDYNRAVDDYSLVAEQNPGNVLIYYNRAAVYAQLGDIDNAIADYTRAIEIYGDFANAYLYRSNLKALKGDRKGFYADQKKAEDLIEKYRSELNTMGNTAFSDTSARFSDIISFNADFEEDNLHRLGNSRLSRYQPQKMFRLSVVDTIYKRVGYDPLIFESSIVESAISNLKVHNSCLSKVDNSMPGWQLMSLDTLYANRNNTFAQAMVSAQMRQYSVAMELYSSVIESAPRSSPFAYLNRAVTEAEMLDFMSSVEGNYQSMSVDNDPANRLNDSSKEKKPANYSAIISDLKRCTELLPELPHAYYNLGYMYSKDGNLPESLRYYTKAIEIFPYFAEAYYNRALVQLTLDEKEKAALDLSRAGELGLKAAYTIIDKL